MSLLKHLFACLTFLILNSALSAQNASELIQNKQYKEVIELIKDDSKNDSDLLLRARAQFLSLQFEDTVLTTKKIITEHPSSKWLKKAQFLQAQAQRKLKKYQNASELFEKEAETLFSPDYKDKGAKLLMEVAATFSYSNSKNKSEKNTVDIPKAVKLLSEALSLDCSIKMKESLLAELVFLHSKSEKWKGALSHALNYLEQFDPNWKGELDSTDRLTTSAKTSRKIKLIGKNRYKIRFHLCEAYHRSNLRITATRHLTEFIAELEKNNDPQYQSLLADSTWLRLMAMRKYGGTPRNLQTWVADTKSYLEKFPTHIHAQSTAFTICHCYLSSNQQSNAITAFQEYINIYHPKFSDSPLSSEPQTQKQRIARKKQSNLRHENAHFEIGKIYLELNEFDKAKQAWKIYSKKFPNGKHWATCQKGLVDIDFNIATHAVETIQNTKNQQPARDLAQKKLSLFITKYPLDKRIPMALFLKGNIHFQHANELDKEIKKDLNKKLKDTQSMLYTSAINKWYTLITKYPESKNSIQAHHLTAFIYENHLDNLDKAIEIYSESKHPNSLRHLNNLKSKKIAVSSESTFSTSEEPTVNLITRNIENVKVSQYWLDIESYFRKARKLENIASLDIDLIEADKSWKLPIKDFTKYKSINSKIKIPFPHNKPGICVIKVESKEFSSTTLVMRSNIDIAIRSNKEEIITYAHLAGNKSQPAGNIQILIADGGKIIKTGTTNKNGVFHFRDTALSEIKDLRVLALSDQGTATSAINLTNIEKATSIKPKVWFNLAKKNYLPGEIVNIGGFVRFPSHDTSNSVFVSPSPNQRQFTLSIKQNHSEKLLYQKKITTSASGIFKHAYKLPSYINRDELLIQLKPDFDKNTPAFNHVFYINQNANPMVSLKLAIDKKWTNENSIINGKVSATYQWGAPYSDKQITVKLPNKKNIFIKTNAKGVATFQYDTQFIESGSIIHFNAETRSKIYKSNTASVLVDPISFSILASTDLANAAAGSELTITAKTILPDESPISKEITLEILQVIKISSNPILKSCNGLSHLTQPTTREEVISTIPLTTDPTTGLSTKKVTFDKAGRFLIKITSRDEKGRIAIAKSFVDIHDSTNKEKLLIFTDKRNLEAGKTAKVQVYSYLESSAKALLTLETDKIIEKRIVTLQPGRNDIPVKLNTAHTPEVRINFMLIHKRQFHTASDVIPVLNKLTLKVKTKKTINNKIVTNEDQIKQFDYTANIQAFDADGNPVKADVFINLSNHTIINKPSLNLISRLTKYHSNSNCGFSHRGKQDKILTEIRDELLRMEQQQGISLQQLNLPINHRRNSSQYRTRSINRQDNDSYISYQLTQNHNNPFNTLNHNGRNFLGNQCTILSKNTADGSIHPNTKLPQIDTLETYHLADLATENSQVSSAFSGILELPKQGKEIIITKNIIHGKLKLNITAIDKNSAIGTHIENLKTNLKIKPQLPNKNLAGTPINTINSVMLNKGSNNLSLSLPDNSTPNKIKFTASLSDAEFLKDIITSPLTTRFSSDSPFHENHPAGTLMAVCSYIQYLSHHKLDIAAQEKYRTIASRLCADLTLSQKNNGSWSQIKNRKASSLIHTALAYQAFMVAKKINVTFEKTTPEKAQNWLTKQQKSLATKHYNSRAIVQMALASSGDADFATCNRLYRERSKMDNVGKAILANVFILLDKNDFTSNLIKEITKDTKTSRPSEAYLNSKTILDSLLINAQIATNQRANITFTHHFTSDIERAIASQSYSKFLQTRKPSNNKPSLTLTLNGKTINPKNTIQENLNPGKNEVKIESSHQGIFFSTELIGRKKLMPSTQVKGFTIENRKYFRSKYNFKGIPLRSRGTSPVVHTEIGDIIHVHLKGKINNKNYQDSILTEEIPVGFSYLPGSLRGNHSGARRNGNHLVITYGSLPDRYFLSYTLVAEHPGKWTHNPTLLSFSHNPKITSNNTSNQLIILPKGTKDNSPYQLNRSEHYELAQLYFEAKEYQIAKKHIIAYRKLHQNNEDPNLAKMLLWIETTQDQPDAQLLADSFEILTERKPDLLIPFDKILKVGKAYRKLGEFERSIDVYTATLEAGYTTDSYVGAALEDQGKFIASVDYQNRLWFLYPDLEEIISSRFALSQQIYSKAAKADSLGINPNTKKPYTKKELIELSIKQTKDFLTHSSEHALADDAAFSLANALFAIKGYNELVSHTQKAIINYKDSEHATSFRYMQALAHFWIRNYDQAIKSASAVAKGNSDDKDLAAFITAQIYHAKGMPEKAIQWYKGIEKAYPDAKESMAYFEKKSISLDEVKVLNSGEKFSFKLKYRNIKEAQFQVYRVDLMKLYLREKNLSNIADVNLAGITPKHTLTTKLGNGNDYQEQEKIIELPVNKDGAYLVICRGDYLHTTGLVLITPLKLEVQENPANQKIRVNVSDKKSGEYIDSVHIKAIGFNDSKFKSGETDLRGIWETENITSPTTIIAKDPKGRYAFFQSKINPALAALNKSGGRPSSNRKSIDWNSNLIMKQDKLNRSNIRAYEKKRRSKGKGVEIKKARKK